MIACLGKNPRGRPLFGELAALSPDFVDLGVVDAGKQELMAGAMTSFSLSLRQTKLDARFSPAYTRGLEAGCRRALRNQQGVEAVLFWGATAIPTGGTDLPYFVVTDGPFDPDDPKYPAEWRPKRWRTTYLDLQKRVFGGARHVFTLSEWARQKILNVHGIPSDKVTRIGWGPIGNIGGPLLRLDTQAPLFLSVGSDWRRKGMDLVAGAAPLIRKALPAATVVAIGVPGDLDVPDSEGFIGIRRLLPGTVVHRLLREATALLIPARFDASPHVVYEALQYGTPVIGSQVCGLPEAIQAPKGGVALPNPDAASIARACLELPETAREDAYQVYRASGGWASCAKIVFNQIQASLRG